MDSGCQPAQNRPAAHKLLPVRELLLSWWLKRKARGEAEAC
jgi:hypothetical protein